MWLESDYEIHFDLLIFTFYFYYFVFVSQLSPWVLLQHYWLPSMHRRPLPGSRSPKRMCHVSIRDIYFWTKGIKRKQRLSRSVEIVWLLTCLFAWLAVSFGGCFFCRVVFLFVCLFRRLVFDLSVCFHVLLRFSCNSSKLSFYFDLS